MGLFLVDIDGTAAIRDYGQENPRHWFDWSRVREDKPNEPVVTIVRTLADFGHTVVFISGRSEECFADTLEWLRVNVGVSGPLFMRKKGDYRSDAVVKREIYQGCIEPITTATAVFDDRNSVVEMWRSIGLTCLQVAEGDF